MRPIDFDSLSRTPDAEECWIAQEDFWVKRELLYVVKDAMQMAAHLDPVADASDKKETPAAKDAKPAAEAKDKPAADAPDKKEEAPAKDAKYSASRFSATPVGR